MGSMGTSKIFNLQFYPGLVLLFKLLLAKSRTYYAASFKSGFSTRMNDMRRVLATQSE
jgi:hypothetical protein